MARVPLRNGEKWYTAVVHTTKTGLSEEPYFNGSPGFPAPEAESLFLSADCLIERNN